MNEMIAIRLDPTKLQQEIYIMSNDMELVPIKTECTIDELPNRIVGIAERYNIHYIKLAGATEYTQGIRDKLIEAINYNVGADNDFIVALF